MQKKTRIFLFSLILAIIAIPAGYAYLSIKTGAPLALPEFIRFSRVIIFNSIVHAKENGGSLSLQFAEEAIMNPVSEGTLIIHGKKFFYPLPKLSIFKEDKRYLTFASLAELQNYFYKELPAAGWKHVEQMGSGYFFECNGSKMIIVHNFYLGKGISRISFTAGK